MGVLMTEILPLVLPVIIQRLMTVRWMWKPWKGVLMKELTRKWAILVIQSKIGYEMQFCLQLITSLLLNRSSFPVTWNFGTYLQEWRIFDWFCSTTTETAKVCQFSIVKFMDEPAAKKNRKRSFSGIKTLNKRQFWNFCSSMLKRIEIRDFQLLFSIALTCAWKQKQPRKSRPWERTSTQLKLCPLNFPIFHFFKWKSVFQDLITVISPPV